MPPAPVKFATAYFAPQVQGEALGKILEIIEEAIRGLKGAATAAIAG
jgi:hypothetical protein